MQKIYIAGHRGMGWKARIGLREGIEDAYRWFREHEDVART